MLANAAVYRAMPLEENTIQERLRRCRTNHKQVFKSDKEVQHNGWLYSSFKEGLVLKQVQLNQHFKEKSKPAFYHPPPQEFNWVPVWDPLCSLIQNNPSVYSVLYLFSGHSY